MFQNCVVELLESLNVQIQLLLCKLRQFERWKNTQLFFGRDKKELYEWLHGCGSVSMHVIL